MSNKTKRLTVVMTNDINGDTFPAGGWKVESITKTTLLERVWLNIHASLGMLKRNKTATHIQHAPGYGRSIGVRISDAQYKFLFDGSPCLRLPAPSKSIGFVLDPGIPRMAEGLAI